MKRIFLTGLFATVVTCFTLNTEAAEPNPPVTPEARLDLFNGKDFSGWAFYLKDNGLPAATFTVTNGVIHCTGQPNGYIRTDRIFEDYKLTVEWRFVEVKDKADNSGILVHLQPPDQIWPKCVEIQGKHKQQGNFILMGGVTCPGHETPQTRSIKMLGAPNENPPGEWNTCEVVCRGDAVKTYVNGKLMNEFTGGSVSSGSIGIQSEGGEWELRKIFVEPLP